MSLNKLTENSYEKKYLHPYFSDLKVSNGINMNNSGLVGVTSINGHTIPGIGFDVNPVNIIYKPASPVVAGSNVVGTWEEVLLKASQININQILNIYFDTSLSLPCHITTSYDFKHRARFFSSDSSAWYTDVRIDSGIQISNILSIDTLNLSCQSIDVPSLVFTSNEASSFYINNSQIINTADCDTAAIIINGESLFMYISNNSTIKNPASPTIPLIAMVSTGILTIYFSNNDVVATNLNDTIADDGTCTLNIYADSSLTAFPSFSGFTGSYNQRLYDLAVSTKYDDSKQLPVWTASNVQAALDYIKSNYIPLSNFFGDGSDGNITISSNTTLTRDMNYDTLTVTSSARIDVDGYRIYCKTALTGDGTGIISMNGASPVSSSVGGVGSSGTLRFGGRQAGVAGGITNTNGNFATQGNGPGGQGGRGGDSSTSAKVAGLQPAAPLFSTNLKYFNNPFFGPGGFATSFAANNGSSGAGSLIGRGGSSASGAGKFCILAKTFGNILRLEAKGANGGNADDPTGGVGGGSGGGFVYVIYRNLVSFDPNTQIDVSAGINGTIGSTLNATQASPGQYNLLQV